MSNPHFQVGDIVGHRTLKDGPAMVVVEVCPFADGPRYGCAWMNGEDIAGERRRKTGVFYEVELTKRDQ